MAPGVIHGLVGENGAGKSTLIKCLAGFHRCDSGTMRIDGAAVVFDGPRDAERHGLRFIHQELSLVPAFDAVGNVFVGRPHPTRFGMINRRAMRRVVADALADFAPDLPLDRPVKTLTIGQRQMVEIARALLDRSRLIVMDEPTAALGATEAARLHNLIRALAAAGTAVIYVSHRLTDVLEISSTLTVLRNGASVFDGATTGLGQADLVAMMSGHERRTAAASKSPRWSDDIVLTATGLRLHPNAAPFDLSLRAGEIVGLYGLVGSGRSRLLKTLWGAMTAPAGAIAVGQRRLRPGSISAAMAGGMAFVPEDRRTEGLVPRRTVADNLALPHLRRFRVAPRLPWPSRRRIKRFAVEIGARLGIRFAGPRQAVGALSGGNQQKVLVGRWLRERPRVLLLDEPTRGVDVAAKADLHDALRALAGEGTAVLVATSDIEEALALCSRIGLIRDGTLVDIVDAASSTPASILGGVFRTADGDRAA